MKKYFGKYTSSGDVQTALDDGALSNPYVASVSGSGLDYNGKTPIIYSAMPLTFEALSSGDIKFVAVGGISPLTIEYSKNGGSWTSITAAAEESAQAISVVAGDKVEFRGDNEVYGKQNSSSQYHNFKSTAEVKMYGNLNSLRSSSAYTSNIAINLYIGSNAYAYLFYNMRTLIDASNLIITAQEAGTFAMYNAFSTCLNLVNGPKILIDQLGDSACWGMFNWDGELTKITCTTTTFGNNATRGWVIGAPATGTFVKKAGVSWETGNNGIPNGWTVIEE